MGVLAPGSAHARPSARPPIDTSGNFPAPVSAEWPSALKTVKKILKLESSYFCYLGAHAKIWNTTTTPSGVLATAATTRKEKFMLTPMGVLAPGFAHERPSSQPPINVSGNFPAHVSAE